MVVNGIQLFRSEKRTPWKLALNWGTKLVEWDIDWEWTGVIRKSDQFHSA